MRYACSLLVLVVLSWISVQQAAARIWTDKKGKEIEAELVEVKSGMAVLKLENGKTIKKALATLSQEDQEFIKENTPAEDPAPMPKKPATKKPTSKKPVPADSDTPKPADPDSSKPVEAAKPAKGTTTSKGVTIEVVGLSINKPLPPDPAADPATGQGMFMPMVGHGQTGTKIVLSLADPERQIVSLDADKSKITVCTDDAGGDLSKDVGVMPSGFSPFPLQLRPGRHFGVVEINEGLTPSAKKIHLQGQVVLQCGTGEKMAEQADVPLKSAGQITAGPVPFTIAPAKKDAGFAFPLPFKIEGTPGQEQSESKIVVTLTTNQPYDIVKKIVFLNAAGKEIVTQEMGSGTSIAPGPAGKMTYDRTIGLSEDIEKATVRIVFYETFESISVPIDFEIGVGF